VHGEARMIGVEVGQRYYQIMNATPWVAWIGACSGLGSLLWNIYTKVTSGARLRVTAYAGMILMPPPPHNPRILKITVKNIGTVTTTITNVTFHSYGSRWKRFKNRADVNAVINTHSGPQFPHKLEVGGQWVATMEQDDKPSVPI
jgi:hypothetical protein